MPRTHNTDLYTTSSDPLRDYLARANLSPREFAEIIGVAATTPGGWLKDGRMPKVVLLAIELLTRAPTTRLIVTPGEKLEAVRLFLSAMSIPFTEV